MLDEEIKKLLNEIKMNDPKKHLEGNASCGKDPSAFAHDMLEDEQNKPKKHPEQQYKNENGPKSHVGRTKVLLAIACAVLAPAGYMAWQTPENQESSYIAYNAPDAADDDVELEPQEQVNQEPELLLQQEREAVAAAWAKEIVDISVEDGRNVQVLWDMLRRRREDLEETTRELSDLLTNNAKHRQDFYAQTASVLLSRYQAIDARYSVEVANQINAIYAQIKEANNPHLTQAWAEMLGELGAESYSTHQIQIAKQLLKHEEMCQKALLNLEASKNLPELEYNLRLASQLVHVIETNGLLQTFHEGREYQNMMSQKCKETLDRILVKENASTLNSDSIVLVQGMLADVGLELDEIQKYTDKLNALLVPDEASSVTIHANC